MEDAKPGTRRRHGRELKRQVLDECAAPGASVAKVALSHGLNVNLVHKWRREADGSPLVSEAKTFVPVALASAMEQPAQPIQLELQRGTLSVRVIWPASSVGACAAWLREILR